MQMLNPDAMPQEGMIFHCAGQASGGWRVFDIWDLQGAFDQFLLQAALLIAKGPHFPQPPKNSINFQIQNLYTRKLAFAPPDERDQLAQWLLSDSPLADRMHRNRVLHFRNATK
jgi:hypothetical protein